MSGFAGVRFNVNFHQPLPEPRGYQKSLQSPFDARVKNAHRGEDAIEDPKALDRLRIQVRTGAHNSILPVTEVERCPKRERRPRP